MRMSMNGWWTFKVVVEGVCSEEDEDEEEKNGRRRRRKREEVKAGASPVISYQHPGNCGR